MVIEECMIFGPRSLAVETVGEETCTILNKLYEISCEQYNIFQSHASIYVI